MTDFNQKHEVIIQSELYYNGEAESGTDVEHNTRVVSLNFYTQTENGMYSRINITPDFIKDLYKQIQDIEKRTEKQKYYETIF
jgi:hypothetical protein